jgi:hypothetical protein
MSSRRLHRSETEFNDCDDAEQAKDYWVEYLAGYETKFWDRPDWTVWRQGAQSETYRAYYENFDFGNNQNVAFCAISVPGGDVNTSTQNQEFLDREDANMAWIHDSYQFYRNSVDVLFILLHDAIPGSNVANRIFFTVLLDRIKSDYSDLNFVIVHRNALGDDANGSWLRSEYNGIPNLSVLSVHGPSWPPLQVTIPTNGNGVMPDIAIDGGAWYYDLYGMKRQQ